MSKAVSPVTGRAYGLAKVARVYYAECAQLIKEFTGAARVHVFDHIVRNAARMAKGNAIKGYAGRVHNDYTAWSAPQRVRDLMGDEAEELLQHRYAEINVWRPIRGLPDHASLRSIRTGTTTRQPCSTRRRANCDSAGVPGVSPTSISGVWSASGIATADAFALSVGSSSSPSPSTPASACQRTAHTW